MKRPGAGASSSGRRAQMRNQGYVDGRSGRAARHLDAEYQASYRRGIEAAKAEAQQVVA